MPSIHYMRVGFVLFLSVVNATRGTFRGTRGISHRTLQNSRKIGDKGSESGKKEGAGGKMKKTKGMGILKGDDEESDGLPTEEGEEQNADDGVEKEKDTNKTKGTKSEDEDGDDEKHDRGKEFDVCDPNPCFNGDCATESSPDGDAEEPLCSCNPGYVGQFCDIIDPCLDSPCQNDATCNSLGRSDGEYSCECDEAHVGRRCQYVDPCFPTNPCLNGGSCVVLLGSVVDGVPKVDCACADGFDGKNCETESS
jgi:hypothetical protein